MILVILYSALLLMGMLFSQFGNLSGAGDVISTLTMTCLAYIMIEVGLEFTIDKKKLKTFGWDYLVAMTAATFPWVLCALYFVFFMDAGWVESWFVGRFAAPTSAGILFSMLAAVGLGTTWLFKKVRVLAIFDDLDTILLMIPLQMMVVGVKPELIVIIFVIIFLLSAAYKWLHTLKIPTGKRWLLAYGALIVGVCELIEKSVHVHLEVLLPAFALGCIIFNPHDPDQTEDHRHEHEYLEPEGRMSLIVDRAVKGSFMFLVGCSLPKIDFGEFQMGTMLIHIVAITFLANLGKCFPAFCYRKEASLKERIAVFISMLPRGEVGAGVLLVAMSYGFTGVISVVAALSLAINLLMTGLFISAVIWLLKSQARSGQSG
ncbi:MAG: sodium:proton antiporter [Candidatus Omnitrophica bacterium]|nr:sodium:proton antiporter [Candidatus Omnitrophota bacterium]